MSINNDNSNNQNHDSITDEEIEEPKLSYERVLNDLSKIIKTDSITSSCLHGKFIAIGTLYGRIHLFDHQGNKVDKQELCVHLKSVNCISIDTKGDYLISCSNDRLVVYGLCNSEHNFVLMPDKPMNVVAIDPHFYKSGSGRRFVAGDDRVTLYERGFLARYKSTVLQSKLQKVRSLSWHDQFIAWATDSAVQIFDVEQRAIITRIKRDADVVYSVNPQADVCQFSWKNSRTLLVGWCNTVKVCLIKERSHEVLSETQLGKELPRKYVEIVSMFETDFTICGLAPFNDQLLVLSIANNELTSSTSNVPQRRRRNSRDTNSSSCDLSVASTHSSSAVSTSVHTPSTSVVTTYAFEDASALNADTTSISAQSTTSSFAANASNTKMQDLLSLKPQVHILKTSANSYTELSKDVLTPNGYVDPAGGEQPSVAAPRRSLLSGNRTNPNPTLPYSLLSIHSDGIYFIVSPKDVISAKPRDYDDHIDWLIEHAMLEQCCVFARQYAPQLVRHTLRDLEQMYKRELLAKSTPEAYGEAARLSASICNSNQELWDECIREFCDLGQLKHLLPYLPRKVDAFYLHSSSYDFVLNEFLYNDSVSFFKAIKEIPCQLYSLQSMTDQVIKCLANDPKNLVLNEALAELYTRMGRFEEAVNIYLDYNDKTRIFTIIRRNNLVSILRDKVDRLMHIDSNETSQLLVENIDSIPMRDVVERLEQYKSEKYLMCYLHRLVLKDPDSCIEYHDLLVKLYAKHQRESLMNFLKLSTNYRLEEALRICKEANLIKEVVFLHGRMGDLRIALKYITESQGDINEAIEFCKEHQDPELWQDLILYSINEPRFIGALLKNIGTHINDPIELIDRIPNNCQIDGLMPALVKILQDYQLQISLERSCRDLMAKDCFSLLQKQIRCQTQGIAIKEDQLCDHCAQPLLADSDFVLRATRASTTSAATDPSGASAAAASAAIVGSPTGSGATIGAGVAAATSNAAAAAAAAAAASSGLSDLVVFGCHHVFHEECCVASNSSAAAAAAPNQTGADADSASAKILTCRVCMLEKDYDSNSVNTML